MHSWPIVLLAALAGIDAGRPEPKPAGLASRSIRLADGSSKTLVAPKHGVLVVVFYSTECPISNAYSPTLNALARGTKADAMRMVGLCVDPDKADADLKEHAREFRLAFPTSRDSSAEIAQKLGVKVTPEAVVIDDQDRIRYSGRIDDLFPSRGKRRPRATEHELRDAIAAVLAGRDVARARVEAVGCPLPEVDPPG